jgi:hypothetical protein
MNSTYRFDKVYVIVAKADKTHYIACDLRTEQYDIIDYDSVLYQAQYLLLNAYADTASKTLKGYNINLETLPILTQSTPAPYYVYARTTDSGKVFVQPYGDIHECELSQYVGRNSPVYKYAEFLKKNKILGGCGDTLGYAFRFKPTMSPIEYTAPIVLTDYLDGEEKTLRTIMHSTTAYDYIKLPWGIVDYNPFDIFYNVYINRLELSSSVMNLSMKGMSMYSVIDVRTLVIPSSVSSILYIPESKQNELEANKSCGIQCIECNPNGFAWHILSDAGWGLRLRPNYNI